MNAEIEWRDTLILAAGITLAADATNYHALDLEALGADVALLQVDVAFGATPDAVTTCTVRASLDRGAHPDVGTHVATFNVTQATSETRRRTYLLANPYPHYRIEIFNDDSADDVTYTLRARVGRYRVQERSVAITALQQRVNAARA